MKSICCCLREKNVHLEVAKNRKESFVFWIASFFFHLLFQKAGDQESSVELEIQNLF